MDIISIKTTLLDALNLLKFVDKEFYEKHINKSNKYIEKKMINTDCEYKTWIETGSLNDKYEQLDFNKFQLKRWPIKSKLLCWNCTRNIHNPPLGIPYEKKDDIYYLYGAFCSFSCTYSWINQNKTIYMESKDDLITNLYDMYYSLKGKGEIKSAPPKELLLKYGGFLTDDEYENIICNKLLYGDLGIPPLISIKPSYIFTKYI